MTLGAHMRPYSYMYCAPYWDGVLHQRSSKEVGIIPTFVYFPPYGLYGCVFSLRGCLALFRNMEILPYFDPTHWPDFRTDFWVGTRGNSDSGPSCKL